MKSMISVVSRTAKDAPDCSAVAGVSARLAMANVAELRDGPLAAAANPEGQDGGAVDPFAKTLSFECVGCGLKEDVHYVGRQPPFARKAIQFQEDAFVMHDPFAPRVAGRPHFLLVGGTCRVCSGHVCVDCSVFYDGRFCLDCAARLSSTFPVDVRNKIEKKMKATRQQSRQAH